VPRSHPEIATGPDSSEQNMPPPAGAIHLGGVRVHNLKNVTLDIPLNCLTVITGVSGSGKSSLAFDTLYAEGQRRYLDSFSPAVRRSLERFDRPDLDHAANLPPAVALRQTRPARSHYDTLATVTGIDDLLRTLLARIGLQHCPGCGRRIVPSSPDHVTELLRHLPSDTRFQLAFPVDSRTTPQELAQQGFTRGVVLPGSLCAVSSGFNAAGRPEIITALTRTFPDGSSAGSGTNGSLLAVVDRLTIRPESEARLRDSLATCFAASGRCVVFVEQTAVATPSLVSADPSSGPPDPLVAIDGRHWVMHPFSERRGCAWCDQAVAPLESRSLSFRSPLGACTACHGTGVASPAASRRSAPSATNRSTGHTPSNRTSVEDSSSSRVCGECAGSRLSSVARSVRLPYPLSGSASSAHPSLADLNELTVDQVADGLRDLPGQCDPSRRTAVTRLVQALTSRCDMLRRVGLGKLELNRPMDRVSRGEARRIELAAVLATGLVESLFVLDEPAAGFHPADRRQIVELVCELRDRPDTLVVVEHAPEFLAVADHIIEIGPGAGRDGGTIVCSGTPAEVAAIDGALTAALLRTPQTLTSRSPRTPSGWLTLTDARCHGLEFQPVRIPLDCLCVVTGRSGAGRTSLMERTLYPALCERLGTESIVPDRGTFQELTGADAIRAVDLVNDRPLGGSRRSCAATWLKVLDPIRHLFADTAEARQRGFKAAHFSFNTDAGGRCPKCTGTGYVDIDMHFLPDVSMTCPDCHGTRFQTPVLEVSWRGRSITDVLEMTAAEAFGFFRGQPAIQKKLRPLSDVGLDYLTLGQPLSTLSGGEARRLRLAAALGTRVREGSLLILDTPTEGLHPVDVRTLLNCLDGLLAVGHSLVILDNHPDMVAAADCTLHVRRDSAASSVTIETLQRS